jgi:hypothetical protein
MECADNAALEDRPEAFDGLSVDRSNDILVLLRLGYKRHAYLLQAHGPRRLFGFCRVVLFRAS